jgi:hypothetical protein
MSRMSRMSRMSMSLTLVCGCHSPNSPFALIGLEPTKLILYFFEEERKRELRLQLIWLSMDLEGITFDQFKALVKVPFAYDAPFSEVRSWLMSFVALTTKDGVGRAMKYHRKMPYELLPPDNFGVFNTFFHGMDLMFKFDDDYENFIYTNFPNSITGRDKFLQALNDVFDFEGLSDYVSKTFDNAFSKPKKLNFEIFDTFIREILSIFEVDEDLADFMLAHFPDSVMDRRNFLRELDNMYDLEGHIKDVSMALKRAFSKHPRSLTAQMR